MSRVADPTAEQEKSWKEWVATLPDHARAVAERFDPWSLYRMKSTGHRVTLVSVYKEEDGRVSLTVDVSAKFNAVMFERQVFGVDPNDLEPCEPPAANEPVGIQKAGPKRRHPRRH